MLSPPTYCPWTLALVSLLAEKWLFELFVFEFVGFFVAQTLFISWLISHYDKNCWAKENGLAAGFEIWKHCQGYLRTKYTTRAQKQAIIGFKFFVNLCFVFLVGTSGTDSSGEGRVVSGAKECSYQTTLHINTCFHWHSDKIRERTYSCAAY